MKQPVMSADKTTHVTWQSIGLGLAYTAFNWPSAQWAMHPDAYTNGKFCVAMLILFIVAGSVFRSQRGAQPNRVLRSAATLLIAICLFMTWIDLQPTNFSHDSFAADAGMWIFIVAYMLIWMSGAAICLMPVFAAFMVVVCIVGLALPEKD